MSPTAPAAAAEQSQSSHPQSEAKQNLPRNTSEHIVRLHSDHTTPIKLSLAPCGQREEGIAANKHISPDGKPNAFRK